MGKKSVKFEILWKSQNFEKTIIFLKFYPVYTFYSFCNFLWKINELHVCFIEDNKSFLCASEKTFEQRNKLFFFYPMDFFSFYPFFVLFMGDRVKIWYFSFYKKFCKKRVKKGVLDPFWSNMEKILTESFAESAMVIRCILKALFMNFLIRDLRFNIQFSTLGV